MRAVTLAPLLASIGHALPQAFRSCYTTTEQVTVPTSTGAFRATHLVTETATTPQVDTYTSILRISSTTTLETLTQTETECTASEAVTAQPTTTVYTTKGGSNRARTPSVYARQDDDEGECTVTVTSTTSYGVTYTEDPIAATRTYTRYSEYSQATATATSSGFTAYAIATSLTSVPGNCGPTVDATSPTSTSTVTQDARCAPSAIISAAGVTETSAQFGLAYAYITTTGGSYLTNTTDASSCCQVCAEAEKCAASSWDIRTGECRLAFPVDFESGELSCGNGLMAYYGAGPAHPMEPGSGLYVAQVCGTVTFTNAKPDDGT